MTVKELIEKLQQMPPDASVRILDIEPVGPYLDETIDAWIEDDGYVYLWWEGMH